MAKLKVFTLGIHGFINTAVREALGLPRHIRQAHVYVSAPTKAAAVQVLAERGFPHQPLRDPEFRITGGNDVDGLTTAGLFDKPTVLVTPSVGTPGDGVVEMQPGGEPRVIGHLHGGWGEPVEFIPEEG